MSQSLEITIRRDNGKVFIEMNSDSLACHFSLLEVVVTELLGRLSDYPWETLSDDSKEYLNALTTDFTEMDQRIYDMQAMLDNSQDTEMPYWDDEPTLPTPPTSV